MDEIQTTEAAVESAQDRIQLLLREIGQIHPRLQERLSHALNKFPLDISRKRAANDDLLAMTIEASLVKVSFMRAQALGMLYDHRSSQNPELTMRGALKGAYAKLQAEEREMEEEECKLDRELTEYQTLLDMVDGGGRGGFRQIVADFARVEKELEECKKDLRRLGWTREDS
ncbi:hypothetical protein GGX14DRAFT_649756 [Mycena pura]|uniref:Uncharacterized protein n=1 Tax=Mycena pura TaxID=153505 RepID=A0AAD6YN06_9AGAR|nr:hypothetical protein GGX14DRAFT_649756 [Mycena pura]